MQVPAKAKIYHILHVDHLPSIVADGCLWSDSEVVVRGLPGTSIGLGDIWQRRLTKNRLQSHPELFVGSCVPFYFCPRSVMLYILHRGNMPGLVYKGGQAEIVHLEADFHQSVTWADYNGARWAFTLSNAGSAYFEDRAAVQDLSEVDWSAVEARDWRDKKEEKQAEFLMERRFPWQLVDRIGTHSPAVAHRVHGAIAGAGHRPRVEVMRDWYY